MRAKTLLNLASVGVIAGCALWAEKPPLSLPADSGLREVFVDSRGYHTDIGFHAADLSGPLAEAARAFPGAHIILAGFGDRIFITTRDKWLGTWLMTLLPGRGAMLVTALPGTPEAAFGPANVVRLHVSAAQFTAIEKFVNDSFALSQDKPVFIGAGPYLGSRFYASSRTYDLLDTCNTWTAAALASGGLPEPVAFTLFAHQTMDGARRLAAKFY